jgi:uncharacterized tellurite resistance protein B-like protein
MLESLKQFLGEVTGERKHQAHFADGDYRLAAAALLIHAKTIDGEISEFDRQKLHGLLKPRFDLDDAATAELIEQAARADREAIDLYHFTSVINRALDDNGRRRVVEMMWEIVYAYGPVTDFEENLMWRASDLLGVSSRDRIELRRRVAAARGSGTG